MECKPIKYYRLLFYLFIFPPITNAAGSTEPAIIPTVTPNMIFTLATGQVLTPADAVVHNLVIPNKCPVNFKPYVVIIPTKVAASIGEQQLLGSFGVCIQSVTTGANNYTVNYLAIRRYGVLETSLNNNRYIGKSDWQWTLASTVDMPPTSRVENPYNGYDYTTTAGLSWSLYCYPPPQTPPTYGNLCVIGIPPF